MTEVPMMTTNVEESKSLAVKALRPRRFKDPLLEGPPLSVPPIPIYA